MTTQENKFLNFAKIKPDIEEYWYGHIFMMFLRKESSVEIDYQANVRKEYPGSIISVLDEVHKAFPKSKITVDLLADWNSPLNNILVEFDEKGNVINSDFISERAFTFTFHHKVA